MPEESCRHVGRNKHSAVPAKQHATTLVCGNGGVFVRAYNRSSADDSRERARKRTEVCSTYQRSSSQAAIAMTAIAVPACEMKCLLSLFSERVNQRPL
jgi:hypothetical protein